VFSWYVRKNKEKIGCRYPPVDQWHIISRADQGAWKKDKGSPFAAMIEQKIGKREKSLGAKK
jgi:hypothetical protein